MLFEMRQFPDPSQSPIIDPPFGSDPDVPVQDPDPAPAPAPDVPEPDKEPNQI